MSKLNIEVHNYNFASECAGQIWAGSAFAFVAPAEDGLMAEFGNFLGTAVTGKRHLLPLLPEPQALPGFKVKAAARPVKAAPVLLTDKEIYRAGKDDIRLLIAAPQWVSGAGLTMLSVKLVIENNGVIYRSQNVTLNEGGLTLVQLGKLPEGGYRVYLDSTDLTDYEGEKAECRFSSVEYVLSPLQATLLAHELKGGELACRLKVERYNEPLDELVQIELWSGNSRLDRERVKPSTPGIYNATFRIKGEADERLELRVSHLDQLATVVIPGSRKAERDETVISKLGQEVTVSLMPGEGTGAIRGLYLNEEGPVTNTPVTLTTPVPANRRARLRWQVATDAARLLVLDWRGAVVESRDLGALTAGQEFEIEVPAPGAFLAVGGWLGEKAWEGWSVLLAPSTVDLKIEAPTTARPGKEINVKLATNLPSEVYLLVRDSRLAGSGPQERLAASIKKSFEGANKWGKNGYINQKLNEHPDWPNPSPYGMMAGGYPYGDDEITTRFAVYRSGPVPPPMAMPMPTAAPPGIVRPMMAASAPTGAGVVRHSLSIRSPEPVSTMDAFRFGGEEISKAGQAAQPAPRKDFADVAYCALLQTDATGQAEVTFRLPDAITSYSIEVFALSQDGAEWASASESLEVSQPVWAEFKLPAFVYPGDKAPATLEAGCTGGKFRLKLLCDGQPVPFNLSGATQLEPGVYSGNRVKLVFEAGPGHWRSELEDLTTGERDISERTVEALGYFKGLARRFQLLTAGEKISRTSGEALQLRLLPSIEKPFSALCDATANYSHKCCEQTAAKLIAAIAALMVGGEEAKLREVIVAGVNREKKMHLPGRGFMMYPPEESGGHREPNDYWGQRAAEHLLGLAIIGQPLFNGKLDPAIRQALEEAVTMGQDAAKAYKLPLIPNQIKNGRDAYRAVMLNGANHGQAVDYARQSLQQLSASATNPGGGAVIYREEQAYSAATLLAARTELPLAIGAVNRLAKSLDEQGRLYSTVDSTALISLMVALRSAGIGVGAGSNARISLDGQEMPLEEAIETAASGQVEEIDVLEGSALVELTTEVVEDWNSFRAEVPVGVQLARSSKINLRPVRVGDNLELIVKLERYEPGQLVHVCLPPSLSKIEGGGEVKKFSVDFSGRTEVRIPLRATAHTLPGGEHWALLVRNMFKEEEAGNPGVQTVRVSAD
jgi:hypothetical protein